MENPHDINCECEHCTYTRWVVRETMLERDKVINDLTNTISFYKGCCNDKNEKLRKYHRGVTNLRDNYATKGDEVWDILKNML